MLIEDFWRELISVGPRFAGTIGEKQAIELVKERIESIDLVPELMSFSYNGWTLIDKTELRIIDPFVEDLQAYCFIWSPSTPLGGIKGRLEYLGKHEVWGQYQWELFGVLDECNNYIAYVSGQMEYEAIPQALSEEYSSLPHFTIGAEDTKRLLSFIDKGFSITIWGKISADYKKNCSSCNIKVEIDGKNRLYNEKKLRNKKILIMAHLDTLYNTVGAYDNGAGCALLMGLADWLHLDSLTNSVEILFTSGEEFNLAGSKSYCNELKMKNRLPEIGAVINIDGIGRGNILEIWSGPEKFAIQIWPLLECKNLGFKKLLKYPPPPGSDHAPFYNEGCPVVMFSLNDLPILHTSRDVADEAKKYNISRMFVFLKRFLSSLDKHI